MSRNDIILLNGIRRLLRRDDMRQPTAPGTAEAIAGSTMAHRFHAPADCFLNTFSRPDLLFHEVSSREACSGGFLLDKHQHPAHPRICPPTHLPTRALVQCSRSKEVNPSSRIHFQAPSSNVCCMIVNLGFNLHPQCQRSLAGPPWQPPGSGRRFPVRAPRVESTCAPTQTHRAADCSRQIFSLAALFIKPRTTARELPQQTDVPSAVVESLPRIPLLPREAACDLRHPLC